MNNTEGLKELQKTLEDVGCTDILVDQAGGMWVHIIISVDQIHTDHIENVRNAVKKTLVDNKIEHKKLHIEAEINGTRATKEGKVCLTFLKEIMDT